MLRVGTIRDRLRDSILIIDMQIKLAICRGEKIGWGKNRTGETSNTIITAALVKKAELAPR